MEQSRARQLGILAVVLSALGFSAKAILVKLAYRHGVDAITLLMLRMAIAMVFFLALLVWPGVERRWPTRRQWLALGGLSLLGYYLASYLDFLGLEYITASLERLILFLYPTLTVLFSAIRQRQWPRRLTLIAMLVSYLGMALVFLDDLGTPQTNLWLGSLLVMGSATAYALYLTGSAECIRALGSQRFTGWAMSLSCVTTLLHYSLQRPWSNLPGLPTEVLVYAGIMALFSTVLPAILLAYGMARIGAAQSALVGTLGPVFTLILGYFVLQESLSPLQLLGAALILLGVWFTAQKPTAATR